MSLNKYNHLADIHKTSPATVALARKIGVFLRNSLRSLGIKMKPKTEEEARAAFIAQKVDKEGIVIDTARQIADTLGFSLDSKSTTGYTVYPRNEQ